MSYVDPYATHQFVLERYIQETNGDIIEFGIGFGSTPLIVDLIKNTGRILYSVESDIKWLDKIKKEYPETPYHKYIFSKDWNETIPIDSHLDKH